MYGVTLRQFIDPFCPVHPIIAQPASGLSIPTVYPSARLVTCHIPFRVWNSSPTKQLIDGSPTENLGRPHNKTEQRRHERRGKTLKNDGTNIHTTAYHTKENLHMQESDDYEVAFGYRYHPGNNASFPVNLVGFTLQTLGRYICFAI